MARPTGPRDYIADNYHLVQDVEGSRVYVRNDRL